MDDQSLWKKELSFGRKPKEQTDADESPLTDAKPASPFKKELSFKRKDEADAVDGDAVADTPTDEQRPMNRKSKSRSRQSLSPRSRKSPRRPFGRRRSASAARHRMKTRWWRPSRSSSRRRRTRSCRTSRPLIRRRAPRRRFGRRKSRSAARRRPSRSPSSRWTKSLLLQERALNEEPVASGRNSRSG